MEVFFWGRGSQWGHGNPLALTFGLTFQNRKAITVFEMAVDEMYRYSSTIYSITAARFVLLGSFVISIYGTVILANLLYFNLQSISAISIYLTAQNSMCI